MAVIIKTYQFAVNQVGDFEAITVTNRCTPVEIKELPSITPKQLYYISGVASGGDAAEVNAGTPTFFPAGRRGWFEAGETIGYVASATGATTFQRIEYLAEP